MYQNFTEKHTEDLDDQKLMETEEERDLFENRKKNTKFIIEEVQEKIKKNNIDILMGQQVECTLESSFQFFMQTLWLMPALVPTFVLATTSWDDLLKDKRVRSVAISFISMGNSYTSIRL